MIEAEKRKSIIDLVKREVVPAMGCTEPIAVALCVAKATEVLGNTPEKMNVYPSANMLKNAMGVGIPGTGMVGLPIAVALGALVGKSEYQLEVLRDVTPEAVEHGKAYIAENRVSVDLKNGECDKLYIEANVETCGDNAKVVISGGHTNFVHIEKNGEVILSAQTGNSSNCGVAEVGLRLRDVYEFASTTPLNEIEFINDAARLNTEASRLALLGNYGH